MGHWRLATSLSTLSTLSTEVDKVDRVDSLQSISSPHRGLSEPHFHSQQSTGTPRATDLIHGDAEVDVAKAVV